MKQTSAALSDGETSALQTYLRTKFGNSNIEVRSRSKTNDSVEVYMNGEFIAVIYKDTEEGETSYNFNMVVLDIDLEDAG